MADRAERPRVPESGEVIAGKYAIERPLGQGGMGVVLRARHLALNQPVALKFLSPDADAQFAARFAREARAAAGLHGEHVVRIFDVGALPNGLPYMVMECLEGHDLATVAASKRSPFDVGEVVDYVLQACEALAQAHALGIVHRDLKPQNMFVVAPPGSPPLVKLLDFGISKMPASELTTTGSLLGSPSYMSPEQLLTPREVDARSDIWSLGVIMYRLLTGHAPFEMGTLPELCAQIITLKIPPPRSKRSDLPPALERVVLRCLEKDRELRYPSVAELALDLAPFAPPRSLDLVRQIAGIVPLATDVAAAGPSRRTGASRRAAGIAIALGAGAVTLALLGAVSWRGRARKSVLDEVDATTALPATAPAVAATATHAALPASSSASLPSDAPDAAAVAAAATRPAPAARIGRPVRPRDAGAALSEYPTER